MSEPDIPELVRTQLDALLNAQPDQECSTPDVDTLWAYREGTLDPDGRAQVQAALARSAGLRQLMVDWSLLVEVDPDRATIVAPPPPDSIRRAVRARRSRWRIVWHPLPAYGIAAAALVFGLLARPRQPAIENVQVVDLRVVVAGDRLRGAEGQPVDLALEREWLAVTVWLPPEASPAPGDRYRLQLSRNPSRDYDLDAPIRRDGHWCVSFTVRAKDLGSGEQRLRVLRRTALGEELAFELALQLQQRP